MTPVLTYILIGINVAISLWAFKAFQGPRGEMFLFSPWQAARGRNLAGAVLAQFSHADLGHLAFNLITLYFFGPVVERALGTHLLTVYFVSGAVALVVVFLLRMRDPGHRVLGSSGAVTGVLFAAIVLEPSMKIMLLILPIPIPAPLFAVLYLAASTFFMSRGDVARVSHEAHVGGALAGLGLGALLAPEGLRPLLDSLRGLAG